MLIFCHHPQNIGGGERGGLKSLSCATYLNHTSRNGLSAVYELAGQLVTINDEQLIPLPFEPLVKHVRQLGVAAKSRLTAFGPAGLEILSTRL